MPRRGKRSKHPPPKIFPKNRTGKKRRQRRRLRSDKASPEIGGGVLSPVTSGTVLQFLNCCGDRPLSPSPARGWPTRNRRLRWLRLILLVRNCRELQPSHANRHRADAHLRSFLFGEVVGNILDGLECHKN